MNKKTITVLVLLTALLSFIVAMVKMDKLDIDTK